MNGQSHSRVWPAGRRWSNGGSDQSHLTKLSPVTLLMNLHSGKMSRRKQAKPARLNEDEESDLGTGRDQGEL